MEGKRFEKAKQTGERILLAASLLCAGSEGLKSAEIPKDAAWEIGISQLQKDDVDETGAIHLCTDAPDGTQKDRWVISVPGTPMDDYRPNDVKEWIGKAKEKGETVQCYIDAHNHPVALQKKRFGTALKNPQSMPPGTGDLWSIYSKTKDAKELGVNNVSAIVVDGLGVWSYATAASMNDFQGEMIEHLHHKERDQWSPDVGMAVRGWLQEVESNTTADVSTLIESQAYRNLQAAYLRNGFSITYQSFEAAKSASPRTFRPMEN